MTIQKMECTKCFIYMRDYLEATIQNKFFTKYLDEFTNLMLDFTRCVPKTAIYGAKARANLYMKSTNVLYYSFLLKVVQANTAHTRFEKEFAYLRIWLLEHNFIKSENKKNPFESIDLYLDTHFIRSLDLLYEIHDAHSNPTHYIQTIMIEVVDEDDWTDYLSIST